MTAHYSRTPLNQGDCLTSEVITSLYNAVKKLHNNGTLYLDLKPSNIFIFEKAQRGLKKQ
jgi:serine/threonine protein kinase